MDFSTTKQLIIVLSDDWQSQDAYMYLYEKVDETWEREDAFPVSVGKKGMAWGLGLHANIFSEGLKMEGDMKAPAGIFSLGPAFGEEPSSRLKGLKMPYVQAHNNLEYVDDPASAFYNRMVIVSEGDRPWKSSEKMLREDGLYSLGIVIRHNETPVMPGRGSCIFMHKQQSKSPGSAGCTTLPEDKLKALLLWLDQNKHPLLIQMPREYYQTFAAKHSFPLLSALNAS